MFSSNRTVIDSFVEHTTSRFAQALPGCDQRYVDTLEMAARSALETLLQCDCPYHDLEHTILVTDVGQTILLGRSIARGDISTHDWLHAVIAMLFHDVGYLRSLLASDTRETFIADETGQHIPLPSGSTDAYLTPYHVTRGSLYIHERFVDDNLVDVATVASYIEMTRFPVPSDASYQDTDTLAGLVRAADLIGQMADPLYIRKLPRLFAEFIETGDAARMGYKNAGDLRNGYPEFFYANVDPYIGDALKYLGKTEAGQQWVASLHNHLHSESIDLQTETRRSSMQNKLHKL